MSRLYIYIQSSFGKNIEIKEMLTSDFRHRSVYIAKKVSCFIWKVMKCLELLKERSNKNEAMEKTR